MTLIRKRRLFFDWHHEENFVDNDMAYFATKSSRAQALENPFPPKVIRVWAAKVQTMCLIYGVKHVTGTDPIKNGRTGEIRTRDQRIKSPLLYRLSYRPIFMALQNNDPRSCRIACYQKRDF